MRTEAEVLAKIVQVGEEGDMLGFSRGALLPFLSFEAAKPFLIPDATAEQWNPLPLTSDGVVGQMREYMDFAWEKALGHRGLSASRSVAKMREWLWLLGDDEGVAFADGDGNYQNYGVPVLAYICEKYDLPMPTESAESIKRMRAGESCVPGCMDGCGT